MRAQGHAWNKRSARPYTSTLLLQRQSSMLKGGPATSPGRQFRRNRLVSPSCRRRYPAERAGAANCALFRN